jgi:hypothetical protein
MATLESILEGWGEDKLDDYFEQPEEIIPSETSGIPILWSEYKEIY